MRRRRTASSSRRGVAANPHRDRDGDPHANGSFVSSAYRAATFYQDRITQSRQLAVKFANNDCEGIYGFESHALREFADELRHTSEAKIADGFRRIANILPGADRHPLILLVDQFEEVFTGASEAERSLFIETLLDAALDRSGRVSVVLTLRSDFLSATARYPPLDAAIAACSELVPAMSEAELKEAILLPAARAAERLGIPNPLDQGTVELLVEETIGRAGALPLLEFALHRIWEGLAQGTPGADTLRKLGGVGGALAAEADRIADESIAIGLERSYFASMPVMPAPAPR